MKDSLKGQLRFKAYRVVVSQATNENQATAIAQALHKLGFNHCITSQESDLVEVAIQTKPPLFGSTRLVKFGLLVAQLASLSELSGLSDFV